MTADDILTRIDTTLRRAEDLHWSDPGFLTWERDQVGPLDWEQPHDHAPELVSTRYLPGPSSAGLSIETINPMIEAIPPGGGVEAMRLTAGNYPPPEKICWSGPLMLGPEPGAETGEKRQIVEGLRVHGLVVDEFAIFDETVGAAARQFVETFGAAAVERIQHALRVLQENHALCPPQPPDRPTTREGVLAWRQRPRPWHRFTVGPQHRPRRRQRDGPAPAPEPALTIRPPRSRRPRKEPEREHLPQRLHPRRHHRPRRRHARRRRQLCRARRADRRLRCERRRRVDLPDSRAGPAGCRIPRRPRRQVPGGQVRSVTITEVVQHQLDGPRPDTAARLRERRPTSPPRARPHRP